MTLGSDFSGTVEALGAGVTGLEPGDEVFGVTSARFTGAYAEHAVADAGMIARKPRRLGHVDAASVPVSAVTAQQMLLDHAHVVPGQRVLVLGGAGAVGGFAVQLARIAGAHVIATVHGRDADLVARLGAHEVVDASRLDEVAPVAAAIDTVGGELQRRALLRIEHGGVLVSAVSQPDQDAATQRGVTATFMLVQVATAPLARIASLIDAGQLTTRVGTVLPLAEARAAHEMMEKRRPHAPGKIVLTT